jgi:hypothetical protein
MTETTIPTIQISEEVKQTLFAETIDEGQVVLHVSYPAAGIFDLIRIWPTTYLVPKEGGEKSKLVTKENISLAPQWTVIRKNGGYQFTLIFSPLPKGCKVFHMWEDIPEPGGFLISNIVRNETDVYHVDLM